MGPRLPKRRMHAMLPHSRNLVTHMHTHTHTQIRAHIHAYIRLTHTRHVSLARMYTADMCSRPALLRIPSLYSETAVPPL